MGHAAGRLEVSADSGDTQEHRAPLPEKWEGSIAPNGAVFVRQQWVCAAREDIFPTSLGPRPWPWLAAGRDVQLPAQGGSGSRW